MTNEELIAKIKGEIERLKEVTKPHKGQGIILTQELRRSYDYLLSFLSTLEEQLKEVRNPIFDECVANVDPEVMEEVSRIIELEEEYKDYVESDPVYSKLVNRNAGLSIARHFYELGCRRTAEKYDEIEYNRQRAEESVPNDLEEAANEYANKHYSEWDESWDDYNGHNIEPENDKLQLMDAFIAGAKWMSIHGNDIKEL